MRMTTKKNHTRLYEYARAMAVLTSLVILGCRSDIGSPASPIDHLEVGTLTIGEKVVVKSSYGATTEITASEIRMKDAEGHPSIVISVTPHGFSSIIFLERDPDDMIPSIRIGNLGGQQPRILLYKDGQPAYPIEMERDPEHSE